MKIGDYIIAIRTIRGECKIDRRYKIIDILKKGEDISFLPEFPLIFDTDHYYIMHNNNISITSCENFKYDYQYNRRKKLSKIKLNK